MINPPLKFTDEESHLAFTKWGANCGPHALAASCGFTLDRARELLIGFDLKRYTNPTMMENGFNLAGIHWERRRGLVLRDNFAIPPHLATVCRVQWEGRWLNPGVPKMVAYRHTHWIAYFQGVVFCTIVPVFGWVDFKLWADFMGRWTKSQAYDGWHITHTYALSK